MTEPEQIKRHGVERSGGKGDEHSSSPADLNGFISGTVAEHCES
jgi:hypothetical protein